MTNGQPDRDAVLLDPAHARQADLSRTLASHDSGQDGDRGQLLIAAAYQLLAEQGLDGLTIRAVLARTGLARRAFYERFGGKDDLVLAVFGQTLRHASAHYGRMIAATTDPVERLRMIVVAIVLGRGGTDELPDVDSDRRGAALAREHMRLAENRPAELHAALEPLIGLIAAQLAEGMAQGRVRHADADRLAVLVYNLVSTTVQTELLDPDSVSRNREERHVLAGDIWEFCRRAIAV